MPWVINRSVVKFLRFKIFQMLTIVIMLFCGQLCICYNYKDFYYRILLKKQPQLHVLIILVGKVNISTYSSHSILIFATYVQLQAQFYLKSAVKIYRTSHTSVDICSTNASMKYQSTRLGKTHHAVEPKSSSK